MSEPGTDGVNLRKPQPTTKAVSAADACGQWDELLDEVSRQDTRLVVERDGKPVAAVISARDLERFSIYEAQRERDFSVLFEIGEKFKDVPLEELEREVAKAVAEVRAENRRTKKRSLGTA